MLGSSLSMAPGLWIAQLCDVVDIDGPPLQAADCDNPLTCVDSLVSPPSAGLVMIEAYAAKGAFLRDGAERFQALNDEHFAVARRVQISG